MPSHPITAMPPAPKGPPHRNSEARARDRFRVSKLRHEVMQRAGSIKADKIDPREFRRNNIKKVSHLCYNKRNELTHEIKKDTEALHAAVDRNNQIALHEKIRDAWDKTFVDEANYLAELLAMSDDDFKRTLEIVQLPADSMPVQKSPSVVQKAASLADAIAQWTKSGFKVVTEEQYAERKKICEGCDMWVGDGYLGMGKCKKCGCSGAKLRLAPSKCPLDKWGPIV